MPLPRNVDLPDFITANCKKLTLRKILRAYQEASDDDRTDFWNTLADGPWAYQFVSNALTNAVQDHATFEMDNIVQKLGTVEYFYSPDHPPPPPPVVDLPFIVNAFDQGTPDERQVFSRKVVDAPTVVYVCGQLNPIQAGEIVTEVLEEAAPAFKISVPNSCQTTLKWHGTPPEGYTPPVLELTSDGVPCPQPGGGEEVQFEDWVIHYDDCQTSGLRAEETLTVSTPSKLGFGSNFGKVLQLLVDKADQALRCCPPCHYSLPNQLEVGISGYGRKDYNFQIDVIIFSVLVEGDPRYLEFSDKNIGRFARFAWIENSITVRPLEWINFDGQVMHAPSAECTGFLYACSSGVEMSAQVIHRDGSVRHFGSNI